jgi:hypothetical protein
MTHEQLKDLAGQLLAKAKDALANAEGFHAQAEKGGFAIINLGNVQASADDMARIVDKLDALMAEAQGRSFRPRKRA